ncbi:hypothetical protein SAMN05421823_107261 [Catalinimonas alkaloidigena]|uniref:Serine aminopeptidase S33 domain-containing protein n=1 Tax=Catalinimonas alkaloidigena TaxID=1075417 RepID=A0A1G9M490_9BACT|nr:alpha/beta fold hydrolase [Catalinimonas alkaloidigena]SDL69079.1 hypothetical protein SAMN05421823_107261 [Catalinimonas alkaloidigena]
MKRFLFLTLLLMPTLLHAGPQGGITPDQYGIEYYEHEVRTTDGALINMWIYIPETHRQNKRNIVIAGSELSNMSDYIFLADALRKQGYRVTTFDYRGHGSSSPFAAQEKLVYHEEFVLDLKAVYQFIHDNFGHEKVGLMGFSMGSVLTQLIATEEDVDFLIQESVLVDFPHLEAKLTAERDNHHQLPRPADELERLVKEIKVPMLVIASRQDAITPPKEAKKVASKRNRDLLVFEGARLAGFETLKTAYCEKIDDFLNHQL